MDHLEEENYPIKRPTFLTVLCILTFVGSGWALFSAVTTYNTAKSTAAIFNDSLIMKKNVKTIEIDTLKIGNKDQFSDSTINNHDSTDSILDSSKNESSIYGGSSPKETYKDTTTEEMNMSGVFGDKMRKSIMDMITVEKMQHSAIGSFAAALFTLAGAISMWFLRRFGFYLYIIGIIIGIVVPFYIYGNNLLAIGLSAFGSFFGLVFIALYALNLKSMK